MIKEFKEFIAGGKAIDTAVGVVIGAAFTGIVKNIVDGLITPLIALIVPNDGSFENLDIKIHGQTFQFGLVLSAVLTFFLTGLVLFFVVKAINHARSFGKTEAEEATTIETELSVLAEIRDLLEKPKTDEA
jgi:large conductance mechanosensitive channel